MLQVLMKSIIQVEHSTVQDPLDVLQRVSFSPDLGESLARFLLLDGGKNHTYFIFLAHHAIFDAWSLPLLFKDIERIYFNQKAIAPRPFTSFVHHVLKSDLESNRDFWRGYFDALEVVHFPNPSSEIYSSGTAIQKLSLQMQLRHGLKARVTVANLLRAAWSLTLSHYSNTEDVYSGPH
jgi:hypothetical protein